MEVRGLDLFAETFAAHKDKYALIGGTACYLNFNALGIDFRATKDLDIVLIIDVKKADKAFALTLWEFINQGGYEIKEKSSGKPVLYRFSKPENNDFPFMLELFSRHLEDLFLDENARLTPIPTDETISSLSAILLNDDYYDMVLNHRVVIQNVSCITPECLIPLKARAYIDLSIRKQEGEAIDSKNINKHCNDVFNLIQLLTENTEIESPEVIREDLREFIKLSEKNQQKLKIQAPFTLQNLTDILKNSYRL